MRYCVYQVMIDLNGPGPDLLEGPPASEQRNHDGDGFDRLARAAPALRANAAGEGNAGKGDRSHRCADRPAGV